VIKSETTAVAIITLDVVSLGEIGYISNEFAPSVRARIEKEFGIPAANVIINTSHCHGVPARDTDVRTIAAVRQAVKNLVAVRIGAGLGHEDRIQANRRLVLKSGKEADVRHAYSMPADDTVADVGPIDPEIGVVRLDAEDGRTVAVLYNFTIHPIQGVPGGANTADLTGYSSSVIEDNLSDGAIALFLQGCAGDINPVFYKDVDHPRHAEPLGNMLGLSTLKALRKVRTKDDNRLVLLNETIDLPRADVAHRILEMEAEQQRLLKSLGGTTLNLKTFLSLTMKHQLSPEFPSYYSHRYMHEKKLGREDLRHHDAANRRAIQQYVRNIQTMEELTRLATNLRLLRKHQANNLAAEKRTVDTEVTALRLGDFVMVTFPGEATVRIGLNIKKKSPHDLTFVAAYTNGYIYYAPTEAQLKNNVGRAQEDSECILAPAWQKIYEAKAIEMLGKL
ncbi:MAG: hypothetical protein QGG36_20675, partial [Pirellulaceae bacterium]|nr:hypothetical protein [Pirellulaceae bacterium]